MNRETIVTTPEYWTAKTQIDLFNCAEEFMSKHGMNRTQLAGHLGVSKGYVSQLLNGDYDHKLSKLVELALAFGYIPSIEFKPVAIVCASEKVNFAFKAFQTKAAEFVRVGENYKGVEILSNENDTSFSDLNIHCA